MGPDLSEATGVPHPEIRTTHNKPSGFLFAESMITGLSRFPGLLDPCV
jgi:hypothetical protein